MQATTCFHDSVPNPILHETAGVFHDPIAFHAPNGMFNPDSDRRESTIGLLLRRREFPPTRFLLRLEDRNPRQDQSLEALILIQAAARGEGIALQLGNALSRCFAFTGVAQQENVTGLLDHKQGFQRVTLLLPTVIFCLLLRISRTLARAVCPVVPNRGEVEAPSVPCIASLAARASAVRAGSRS